MRFSVDFPGGNGRLLSAREQDFGWEIEFLAESRANEPQPLWFFFELHDLTGEKVRLRLANSMQCLGGLEQWTSNCPVARCDNGPWERVPCKENHWNDAQVLQTWFELPVRGKTLAFAFCYPYQEAQLLETLGQCPSFRSETIGWSNKGRPIRRVYNTASPSSPEKPGIYVIGRQHSGETTGTWQIDGMLRYLSSPAGAETLDRFAWWFVPFVDMDGVEEGFYGKDQVALDLNRAWHPAFPRRVELTAIERDLSRFRQCSQPRMLLDMHAPGHGERDCYFVVGADTSDAFREELRRIWTQLTAQYGQAGIQPPLFKEKPPGSNTSAQAGMTSAAYAHHTGMNGSTYECTYQGDRAGNAYSIATYQEMGACMARALAEALAQ